MSEALRDLDRRFDQAVCDGDVAVLGEILAEDFTFTHATGLCQTKQEYIDARPARVHGGNRVLGAIETEVHGDVGVTRGDLDLVDRAGGRRCMRYVRVSRMIGGRWLLVSCNTVFARDRERPTA